MGLQGTLSVPGDKSISHRTLLLSALAPGTSRIQGLLESDDVRATAQCLRHMGVEVNLAAPGGEVTVSSSGNLCEPSTVLDAQNSGTTMRLMSGILAAQPFFSVLTGDDALRTRPMGRVIQPIRQMGGRIYGRQEDRFAPLAILPAANPLSGIEYALPHPSAQVKSAILLAGLFAQTTTTVVESVPSRDHTERMLSALGVQIATHDSASDGVRQIVLAPGQKTALHGNDWQVPGDFSSAAFFIVAGLVIPNSQLLIRSVNLNPTRIGLMEALQSVGGVIRVENLQTLGGEPVGDIYVESSDLKGDLTLEARHIPAMIDEIPILMVAGAFLQGCLTVTGAEELRKKESDRLAAMAEVFHLLGLAIEMYPDGFQLQGDPERRLGGTTAPAAAGLRFFAHHDHRIAMALAVLNWAMCGRISWEIDGREWVSVSFPGFFETLESLDTQGVS